MTLWTIKAFLKGYHYRCFFLFFSEEEKPAAMHGGDRRNPSPAILASNFLASFLAAVSWRIPSFSSLYPT